MSALLQSQLLPDPSESRDDPNQGNFLPPLPRVSIQAFCESAETHTSFSEAAADRRASRAHITVQVGGLAAAREFYRDAATPNVVVVESSAAPAVLLADLERFAEMCDPGTRVVVIGQTNDVSLYRELIHRGVSEYLVAPVTPMAALRTLTGLFAAPDSDPLGRTVAFVGAKGGTGSSTVAHNVGWSVAQQLHSDVVIADFDLAFGTAGLDFNQDPPQGIAEAVFARERLDEVYLERLMTKCTERLSLIAAPATLDKHYDLGSDAFEPIIDLLRQSVPVLVLDIPHQWTEWARATMLAADDVVITAAPDLANLRNAKNMVDLLKQARPHDRPPVLVLNQVGVPKRPEISPKDFAAALELEITAVIGFEPHLFSTAANNGQMIAEVQASAGPVESFRTVAEIVSGRAEIRRPKKSPLAPLLDKIRRLKG